MRRLMPPLLVAIALVGVPGSSAAGVPTCHGLPATIVGTPGEDVIRGTPEDDVIAALAGDDVVKGLAGDDVVCGGLGRDHLVSRNGRDILVGGPQPDRIEGFSRRPTQLHGGGGADVLLLDLSDEPGYVLDGGGDRDAGSVSLGRAATGGPTTVIRRGPGDFVRDGATTGRYLGIERLVLDERTGYEYYGTGAADRVLVVDGGFPFRATTYGGDDVVTSYEGDDVIDTGRGDDRVDAGPGVDVCLNAERTRGCESRVSP